MTETDTTAVREQIVVDTPIEHAFTVFTGRFGDFKPPEHNLLGAPLAQPVFEPRVGGHIVDRAADGSECRWARILAFDPPERVVFSGWQKGVVDGYMDGPADGAQTPAVGTKCVTTRRIGGASRPSISELTHIDPPRTWCVRGADGPIRAAVDVLVEPVAGSRSRLTISVEFTGHGIGKILVPAHGPPGSTQGMAASSSVWVRARAISPDSIIASSVSSMPFLVPIQSPNSSIQRRSAAGGGSWASSSRAPSVSRAT
jgi:hypothetical protein